MPPSPTKTATPSSPATTASAAPTGIPFFSSRLLFSFIHSRRGRSPTVVRSPTAHIHGSARCPLLTATACNSCQHSPRQQRIALRSEHSSSPSGSESQFPRLFFASVSCPSGRAAALYHPTFQRPHFPPEPSPHFLATRQIIPNSGLSLLSCRPRPRRSAGGPESPAVNLRWHHQLAPPCPPFKSQTCQSYRAPPVHAVSTLTVPWQSRFPLGLAEGSSAARCLT